jgi:hypothetical protein
MHAIALKILEELCNLEYVESNLTLIQVSGARIVQW